MRLSILMGSVAAIALVGQAHALPDRYEQGYSCTGLSGAECMQQQSRLDSGNRGFEKSGVNPGPTGAGSTSEGRLAARGISGDENSDDLGDEVGDTADEAGEAISNAADEAGDEISEAADEAGDAISDAFD